MLEYWNLKRKMIGSRIKDRKPPEIVELYQGSLIGSCIQGYLDIQFELIEMYYYDDILIMWGLLW